MFKLIRKDKKKGFTLVELIVVIAILAVLALILVPTITNYVSRANDSKNQANTRALYSHALLVATETDYEEADNKETYINSHEELVAEAKPGTVSVELADDNTVKSVTYYPESGDGWNFDGSKFTPASKSSGS